MITDTWLSSILLFPCDSASSPRVAVAVCAALQAFLLGIKPRSERLAWEWDPVSGRDLQDSVYIYYKPLFIFKYLFYVEKGSPTISSWSSAAEGDLLPLSPVIVQNRSSLQWNDLKGSAVEGHLDFCLWKSYFHSPQRFSPGRRWGVSQSKRTRRLGMKVGDRDALLIQRVSCSRDSNSTGTEAKAS